ncbi:hypothetical protein [Paenibacillus sp. NPDC101420]|uniref:hypothetical protein n=1 Tax=Paenibacillus sp. NPDC101420 TaxID=3390602 RepID=UPI003CFD8F97
MGEATKGVINEKSLSELTSKRETLVTSSAKLEASIKGNEENNIPFHENLSKELVNNGTLGAQNQEAADAYKQQVREDKVKLTELQAQLTEIDAKIAQLGE